MQLLKSPRDDSTVIALLINRDEAGLRMLVRGYVPRVKGALVKDFAKTLDEIDIDTAIQDALYSIWKKPSIHIPAKGSLETLLFIIAHRRAVDHVRQNIRREKLHALSPPEKLTSCSVGERTEAAPSDSGKLSNALHEIVNRLPVLQRRVIRADLAHGTQAKSELLAEECGTSVGAVYSARFKARKKIREALTRQKLSGGEQ